METRSVLDERSQVIVVQHNQVAAFELELRDHARAKFDRHNAPVADSSNGGSRRS